MENKIRSLLSQGKPTLGTHVSSTWPTLWEVVGATRQFDYIEFGSPYTAWDLRDLDNICRAAELTHTGTMIKIDRNPKEWIAQRAIAAGFEAILFADIVTAREAEECVEAVKLPPEGVNSFLSTRGEAVPGEDYVKRIDDIVIAIMVEKKTLVEELEEVLAIDGLDMVQFGASDYGLSLRTPGRLFDRSQFKEKIQADLDRTSQMAIDAGVRPRIEARNAESCQRYLDQGILDFCIGWDTITVEEWCVQHGKRLREMVSTSRRNAQQSSSSYTAT